MHCQSYESTLIGFFFFTFPILTSILANIMKQACKLGCLKPARFHQLPLISKGCQQSSTSSPEEVLCEPAELQMRVLPPPRGSALCPQGLPGSGALAEGMGEQIPPEPHSPLASSSPCSRAGLVALSCFPNDWDKK